VSDDLRQVRIDKLARLAEAGIAPYPDRFERTHTLAQAARLPEGTEGLRLAGRMTAVRTFGKLTFAHLQDFGGRLQIALRRSELDEKSWGLFHDLFDRGDFVGVAGDLFRTKKGELTLAVKELQFLGKALRPLPEKWHGLKDTELKLRQRYLDLLMSEEARRTFTVRSRMIQEMRAYMMAKGFLEVETPMMQPIPGGAAAKPFVTHHNALDMTLFLRVAPELYLKRLVVGGFEKVFEINRNFRNEGLSTRHNPEFTMMEFYEAYRDYRYLMDFTEDLLRTVARNVLGTVQIPYGNHVVDLGQAFARLTIVEAIRRFHPHFSAADLADRAVLEREVRKAGVEPKPGSVLGELQLVLFEETTEQLLVQPTFIIDYPAVVSPLARRNDANPEVTDRFELYITGREMANGFSELNDPEDQAGRFEEQARAKAAGDEEAMYYDADYVRALEYGLPPTAGEGIGIDRLAMLFTNSPSIRDVILFPHMRPEA